MESWTFHEEQGLIWADPGDSQGGLSEALSDGISSLSPRGEPPELSTYWIDHVLRAADASPGDLISGGNSTVLRRTDAGVRAEAIYDTFDSVEVDLDEFLMNVRAWREQVTSSMPRELPSQAPYQRNPLE